MKPRRGIPFNFLRGGDGLISPRTFPVSSILALAVLGAMAACDRHADRQAPGSYSVQDSSGVSIISNEGPDRTLEPEEVLRIGAIHGDPDVQFHGITALEVDAAGGVWVCDSHESIRYYDSTGVLGRKLGGRGEGPGEAPSYWGGLWLGQNSILTVSVGQDLQVFGYDGESLGARSFRYRPFQQLIPMGPASGIGFSAFEFCPTERRSPPQRLGSSAEDRALVVNSTLFLPSRAHPLRVTQAGSG